MKIEGLVANKAFKLPTTISKTIYKHLKNSIIEGRLKPNQRLQEKDIAELKKRTKKLDSYYMQEKINSYVEENLKIHDKIWKVCGNKFLYQSLVNLAEKYTFYANQVFSLVDKSEGYPSFLDGSHQDHMDLMAAIEARDEKRVEKILLSHWGEGYLEQGKTDDHRLQSKRGGDAEEQIHVSKKSTNYETKTTFKEGMNDKI